MRKQLRTIHRSGDEYSPTLRGRTKKRIERILKEAGIQVYHSSEYKLFRSLCTHKDSVNEFQKLGVFNFRNEKSMGRTNVKITRHW